MPNLLTDDTRSPAKPASELAFQSQPPEQPSRFFAVRFALYLLGVAAIFQAIVFLVGRLGWEAVIPENHLLEYAQLGLLFLTFSNLLVLAIRYSRTRGLYVYLSCLAGMAMIRECDNTSWYENLIGWQEWVAALFLLGVVIFTFRRVLLQQVRAFLRRPSFLVFVLGFMIVVTWAQALGRRELFPVQTDRLVEEALELTGYFLIFMGVIEEWIAHWRGKA